MAIIIGLSVYIPRYPPKHVILYALMLLMPSYSFSYYFNLFIPTQFIKSNNAVWGPTFLNRINNLPLGLANKLFGLTLIPSALLGTLTGGYLGDHFLKFTKGSYFLISSAGMLTSVPLLITAILVRNPLIYWPAIFFTAFFITFALVLNAAIMNAVHPLIRSSAMSTSIFITHILGDAVSPVMIGWISDISDLKVAIMLIPMILTVGAGILIWGAKISSFQEGVL